MNRWQFLAGILLGTIPCGFLAAICAEAGLSVPWQIITVWAIYALSATAGAMCWSALK